MLIPRSTILLSAPLTFLSVQKSNRDRVSSKRQYFERNKTNFEDLKQEDLGYALEHIRDQLVEALRGSRHHGIRIPRIYLEVSRLQWYETV